MNMIQCKKSLLMGLFLWKFLGVFIYISVFINKSMVSKTAGFPNAELLSPQYRDAGDDAMVHGVHWRSYHCSWFRSLAR